MCLPVLSHYRWYIKTTLQLTLRIKSEWSGRERLEREERGKEHQEEKGENGSACSLYFPLFHRGEPIDRSSAQIHQQMLELTVSFNHGKKAQQATSRALYFIFSSLCLLGALCISPQTASTLTKTKQNRCEKYALTNN